MLRAIGRAIQLFFLAVIALLVFGSVYFAPEISRLGKSYQFPEVRIDATIHQDGSLSVIEHRTFEFNGSFSFAYFTLQHRLAGDVTEFSIRDATTEYPVAGTPGVTVGSTNYATVQDGPEEFEATWYFSAQDERRTFTIRYQRRCAVELLGDRAYLNWQAIGTGWEELTSRAEITIHMPMRPRRDVRVPARPATPCLPGSEPGAGRQVRSVPLVKGDVRAWGHGPLQGEVVLPEPATVVLRIEDLKPAQFVEASVLFPAEAVPFLGPPAGPVVGPDAPENVASAEQVEAAEGRLAREANRARMWARFKNLLWQVMAWSLVPVLVLCVVVAFRRDRVPDVPRTLPEPPEDIHPAELALLWSAYRGSFAPKDAYRAQLLHLARDGSISIVADGRVSDPKDLEVRLVRPPADPFDRRFASFLFDTADVSAGAAPVKLSGVKYRGTRRAHLGGWWRFGVKRAKQPLDRLKSGQTRAESIAAFLWAAATAAAGYYLAYETFGRRVGLLLIPAGLLGWAIATRIIPPRLPEDLRTRLAHWKAFRRFLTEFSNLDDAPALAVIIWERYLVYATALGVADRVAKQVRALVPENALPSPWPGAPPGSAGYAWGRSFSTRVPAQAAVSSSAGVASSISFSGSWGSSSGGGGGGGGFSGGGGGGGGGSGGGAG